MVLYQKELLGRQWARGVIPPDKVNGQGGQSVRSQRRMSPDCHQSSFGGDRFTSEDSGLIVL